MAKQSPKLPEKDAQQVSSQPPQEDERGSSEAEAMEQLLDEALKENEALKARVTALEKGMSRVTYTPATPDAELLADLVSVLSKHCGENGTSEGGVETLNRIIRERDEYMAQRQPVHNAFGPLAYARGLVISHVKDSAPDYDVGGRYRLALVSVEDGKVSLSEVTDVLAGEVTAALPFGHVRDHLERRVEDFLTPKAHRS